MELCDEQLCLRCGTSRPPSEDEDELDDDELEEELSLSLSSLEESMGVG